MGLRRRNSIKLKRRGDKKKKSRTVSKISILDFANGLLSFVSIFLP